MMEGDSIGYAEGIGYDEVGYSSQEESDPAKPGVSKALYASLFGTPR